MYKVVWFARFPDGLDRQTARRHWRDVHGPLGRRVPQIERYVQSHVVETIGGAERSGFDGYSCCWYVDEASFRASLQTPEWAELALDAANVFELASFAGMSAVLDERTIVDRIDGPFKAVWVVRFKDEIRRDRARAREAHEYWVSTHGRRFGRAVPGIGRYVQNHCVAPLGVDGPDPSLEPFFDGFSECWFADRAAFERATSSPEWQAMTEDAETFCDVDYTVGGMSAIVDETVVKGERELASA